MSTVTINRDSLRQELNQKLSKITPTNPLHKRASVSYNAPVDQANAECKKLENKGYLVIETYGHDTDCGQVLRYALDENKAEVIDQHITHLMNCQVSPSIREGFNLIFIEDGVAYDADSYDWSKYR